MAIEYNAYFLDYSRDSIALDRKYFYKSHHLNVKGATIFTNKLSKEIKVLTHDILNN